MHNIKYHFINTTTLLLFSFITALTINNLVLSANSTFISSNPNIKKPVLAAAEQHSFKYYYDIIEKSKFFDTSNSDNSSTIEGLELIGTIIKEKSSSALIRSDDQPVPVLLVRGEEIKGYKVIQINYSDIVVEKNDQEYRLALFPHEPVKKITESHQIYPDLSL